MFETSVITRAPIWLQIHHIEFRTADNFCFAINGLQLARAHFIDAPPLPRMLLFAYDCKLMRLRIQPKDLQLALEIIHARTQLLTLIAPL